jgi:hypothetical protein
MQFHGIIFQYLAVLILHPRLGSTRQAVKLLPPPSGPFEVAINTMELIDTTRLDPFAPNKSPRAIMVSAIYSLQYRSSSRRYPYMPSITAGIEDLEDLEYGFLNNSYESLFLHVGCKSNFQDSHLVLFSPAEWEHSPRLQPFGVEYYQLRIHGRHDGSPL